MSRKTIRNFIVSLIFLLITVGIFGFMVYETNAKNNLLAEQISTLNRQNAQEASYLRLQRIAEDSVQQREQLHSLFFAQESDSIDFLNLVESTAPQAGVNLETKSIGQGTNSATNQPTIIVQFSFNGTHDNVLDFIQLLENIPYVSRITDVEFSARASGNWEANVNMEIGIYGTTE